MAKDGIHQAPPEASDARACVDRACQQVQAGKLAARQLADWVAQHGVTESEFRLLWQLFVAAETALASAALAGRGDLDGATIGPAILDQASIAERLAASPAHVSGAVERIGGLGLISPIAATTDRRCQCWQLTFAGRELIHAVLASVSALARDSSTANSAPIENAATTVRQAGRAAA